MNIKTQASDESLSQLLNSTEGPDFPHPILDTMFSAMYRLCMVYLSETIRMFHGQDPTKQITSDTDSNLVRPSPSMKRSDTKIFYLHNGSTRVSVRSNSRRIRQKLTVNRQLLNNAARRKLIATRNSGLVRHRNKSFPPVSEQVARKKFVKRRWSLNFEPSLETIKEESRHEEIQTLQ